MEIYLTANSHSNCDIDIYDKETDEKIGYVQFTKDDQTGEKYLTLSGDIGGDLTLVIPPPEQKT